MRYLRQSSLVNQETLSSSRVLVAGMGGLGQPAAVYLALAGVGTLFILDDDVVEESNLNRQFLFTKKDIGKKKVEIAAERLENMNENVNVVILNEMPKEIKTDVVLDCLDNWPSRLKLWELSLKKNIPVIHGAVDEDKGQIAVFLNLKDTSAFYNKSDKACQVLGATTGIIGSKMALEALKLLSGKRESKLVVYDDNMVEYPIKPGRPGKTKDFASHTLIKLWEGDYKLKKGHKYLFVCKGDGSSKEAMEKARKRGISADSLSLPVAKRLKLL